MLTVNLSTQLVNGSLGRVVEMYDDCVRVNFDDVGTVIINKYTFSVYSRERSYNVATRIQVPLRVAYGLTIHKAQGMSLSSMDLTSLKQDNLVSCMGCW